VRSASALAAASSPSPEPGDAAGVQRALLRALLAFDDPAFPRIDVAHVEARIAKIANPLADPGYRAGLLAFDRAIPFPGGAASFASLPLAGARAVVERWFDSDTVKQRQFIRSVKQFAMIAVYSDPVVWPAIGYGGPFEPRLR
jgi:hypothetical protein